MFEHRLKSHHEVYNITKALTAGRMEVEEYLKTKAVAGGMARPGGMAESGVISGPGVMPRAVLYLHVPFCRKICRFCNMLRMPGEPREDYARLLIREMEQYRELDYIRGLTFEAVYFGGGTPTTLGAESLQMILKALKENFRLTYDAEITFESTVMELTEEKMKILREWGVNRLSIGVQTFQDRGRELLGRTGAGKAAYDKLLRLKAVGFENVNIDIIYHYPQQTIEELEEDLEKVFSLDLGSFSFYSLISNPVPSNMDMGKDFKIIKEEMDDRVRNINGQKWSDDTDQALFDRIYTRALDQGFSLLELTKMSRDDPYRYISARHDGADTLALGAGAGGNLGALIYMNPIPLERYADLVEGAGKRSGILTNPAHAVVSKLEGDLQRGRLPWDRYQGLFGEESRFLLNRLLSERYLEEMPESDERVCTENREVSSAAGKHYCLTQKGVYWGNNICDAFLKSLVIEAESREKEE